MLDNPARHAFNYKMILELKHPTLGSQGTVTLLDGVVIKTAWTGCCRPDPLKAMNGWIEASVREYAKSQNWIVSVGPEATVAKPTSDMQMSDD